MIRLWPLRRSILSGLPDPARSPDARVGFDAAVREFNPTTWIRRYPLTSLIGSGVGGFLVARGLERVRPGPGISSGPAGTRSAGTTRVAGPLGRIFQAAKTAALLMLKQQWLRQAIAAPSLGKMTTTRPAGERKPRPTRSSYRTDPGRSADLAQWLAILMLSGLILVLAAVVLPESKVTAVVSIAAAMCAAVLGSWVYSTRRLREPNLPGGDVDPTR